MVPTPKIFAKDRVGTIIRGNAKVLELLESVNEGRNHIVLCECQHCSEHTKFKALLCDLTSGSTKSCGCLKTGVQKGKVHEKAKDAIGKEYPGGKVLAIVGHTKNYLALVQVECTNCIQHTIYITRLSSLRNGNTTSCGCKKDGYPGEVLPSGCVLIRPLGKKHTRKAMKWLVQCWCSEHTIFEATIDNLRNGHTSSCGCNTGPKYCGYVRADGKMMSCHSMSEVFMMWKLEDEGYTVERPRTALWTPLHYPKGSKYKPDIYIKETGEFIEVKGAHLQDMYPEGWRKQKENREWLIEHRGIKITVVDSKEIDDEYGIPAKWG